VVGQAGAGVLIPAHPGLSSLPRRFSAGDYPGQLCQVACPISHLSHRELPPARMPGRRKTAIPQRHSEFGMRGVVAMTVAEDRGRRVMWQRLVAKMATYPCHFLPLLPTITPNVKLPNRATRLEFSLSARSPLVEKLKSGKNGNVDHPSQLCHLGFPPAYMPERDRCRQGYSGIHAWEPTYQPPLSLPSLRDPPLPPFLCVGSRLFRNGGPKRGRHGIIWRRPRSRASW
jgi:hypothetical protein